MQGRLLTPFSAATHSCLLNGEAVLPSGMRVRLPVPLRTPGPAISPTTAPAALAPLAASLALLRPQFLRSLAVASRDPHRSTSDSR